MRFDGLCKCTAAYGICCQTERYQYVYGQQYIGLRPQQLPKRQAMLSKIYMIHFKGIICPVQQKS